MSLVLNFNQLTYFNNKVYYKQNNKLFLFTGKVTHTIYDDISETYYLNGLIHNSDGPALIYKNGDKEYYENNVLHRKDGPALECILFHHHNEWWFEGNQIDCKSQIEFEKIIKLQLFW